MNPDASEQLIRMKDDGLSPWHLGLGLLGALICIVGAVFHADVWKTVQVWYVYPAYSHCFLILPISGWLIWEKRADLAAETPTPDLRILAASVVPMLLWLIGYYSTTIEIRQIAVIGFVQIALFAVLGWRIYRLILFPALFLFFLIPTGEYLIPPLQRLTANFTDWGLTLFGVVHYRDGTVFELVNGRYGIAEACAGLRFLTATFTLGTLFCYLTYRHWWKTIAFLLACIVLPIAANAVRVLATVMVANYTNNRVAAGVDHIVYGWGFAVAIMLLLLYIGSRFPDPDAPAQAPVQIPPAAKQPAIAKSAVIAAAMILAIGSGPAIAAFCSDVGRPPELDTLPTPLEAHGWMVIPNAGPWQPVLGRASAQFAGTLSGPGLGDSSVDLVVSDYANTARDGSLISMKSNLWNSDMWTETSSRLAHARLGDTPAEFSETLLSSPFGDRLVWSCYWIDGRTTTSPLMVKLLQLRAAIRSRDEAAVIALSTPIEGSIGAARSRLAAVLSAAGGPIVQRLASHAPQH